MGRACSGRMGRSGTRARLSSRWGRGSRGRGGRPAGRPVGLVPGTLLVLDEGSMMSLADLGDIVNRAVVHDAKLVVTGDPMQLQAVETGGGMTMLARVLGFVQLSEAGRFRQEWEAEA